MSRLLETWGYVILLWSLDVLRIEQATADVIYTCPSMKRDWYPSVKPQNSSAPYVLNVTNQNGRSVHEDQYRGRPLYGPGQETYTSKIVIHGHQVVVFSIYIVFFFLMCPSYVTILRCCFTSFIFLAPIGSIVEWNSVRK